MAMIAISTAPRRIAQLAAGTALATLLATAALAQTSTGTIQIRPPTAADINPQSVDPRTAAEDLAIALEPVDQQIGHIERDLTACLGEAANVAGPGNTREARACRIVQAGQNIELFRQLQGTLEAFSRTFYAAAEQAAMEQAQRLRQTTATRTELETTERRLEALMDGYEPEYQRLMAQSAETRSEDDIARFNEVVRQWRRAQNQIADLQDKLTVEMQESSFLAELSSNFRSWGFGMREAGRDLDVTIEGETFYIARMTRHAGRDALMDETRGPAAAFPRAQAVIFGMVGYARSLEERQQPDAETMGPTPDLPRFVQPGTVNDPLAPFYANRSPQRSTAEATE